MMRRLRRHLARIPLARESWRVARRLSPGVRRRLLELLPAETAARRVAEEVRRRPGWFPPDALEIVTSLSARLRTLGPEGDHLGNRWLHHRWIAMAEEVFAAVGDDLVPRQEFDAVCVGAGTRNPFAFPLLLYFGGARRVWVVEPELAEPLPDWRVRWGLQELALRILTGDVRPPYFTRSAAELDRFCDVEHLFFGSGALRMRDDTVRVVPGYLEDSAIPPASVHLVVSRSVLEHVTHIDRCLDAMAAMVAPGGHMVHSIDLTAHDAGDPFAFYYSETRDGERRPDDLNGWRLSDYLDGLSTRGFDCRVVDRSIDTEYRLERSRLLPRYRGYTDDDLRCTRAIIGCAKRSRSLAAPLESSRR
jgi:hypothetical protein